MSRGLGLVQAVLGGPLKMPTNYIDASEQDRYEEMRDEVAEVTHGLTVWEMDFIESLYEWDGLYTMQQAEKLEEIFERHC